MAKQTYISFLSPSRLEELKKRLPDSAHASVEYRHKVQAEKSTGPNDSYSPEDARLLMINIANRFDSIKALFIPHNSGNGYLKTLQCVPVTMRDRVVIICDTKLSEAEVANYSGAHVSSFASDAGCEIDGIITLAEAFETMATGRCKAA
ncbi:MAG TPA: hypothetical protein VGE62_00225 [Candidatus Paceibacterota bacterium]